MSNNYAGKFVSAETAVKAVQPGDWVDYGFGAGFPELLDRALAARRDELTDVKIRGGLVIRPRIEVVESDPDQKAFSYYSWHIGDYERKLQTRGLCKFMPMMLRSLPEMYRHHIRVDVAFVPVSRPDADGCCGLGISNYAWRTIFENARTVIFEINEKGDVKDSRVVHTVIKSDRRFTYEEAQQVIETKEGDFKEEILMLDTIAKALRQKRFVSGAINFDRYEVKFEIDAKGKPISVYFKVSQDANKLVEEFMLLANRTVAEKIGRVPKNKKAKVFPYRIHDLPDPEKLDNLAQFIARFGYKLRTSGTKTDVSKSINHLLDDIQGKKEENLIETVSIRAMQKARYSTHNIGHYGLAFDYYTHFTSPIRRFPDMMVHRLLTKYLDGGRSVSETKYEDLCDHSSNMEQIAANAERASVKYKQVEFMTERLGQIFDGVISGVTEWGLYVELNENKCEGMIPIRDLDDDYYEFDEKNYCLRGRRKHRTYSLGDAITIKVARANLEKKQLDFALVD